MKIKINKTELELYKGDITDLEVDCITNAANDHLWMGSGVAGAIKKKGGKEIEDEAISKGPIEIGEVVVTGAGKLKAKYVLHAAVMGQDLKTSFNIIEKATLNTLKKADELGVESIALPAFGTGVGGLSMPKTAQVIVDSIFNYLLTKSSNIKHVIIALIDDGAFNTFKKEIEERFKRKK